MCLRLTNKSHMYHVGMFDFNFGSRGFFPEKSTVIKPNEDETQKIQTWKRHTVHKAHF